MSKTDIKSATLLLEDGKSSNAKTVLQALIASSPTHTAAHVLLARIHESENDHDQALLNWQDAFSLLPTSTVVQSGLRKAIQRSVLYQANRRDGDDAEGVAGELPKDVVDESLNLELLIQELERARIVPDPDVQEISDDELEDEIEDLVTETLARIYAAQSYFEEARQVYVKLARQSPERAHEFETKALEMQKKAQEKDKSTT